MLQSVQQGGAIYSTTTITAITCTTVLHGPPRGLRGVEFDEGVVPSRRPLDLLHIREKRLQI